MRNPLSRLLESRCTHSRVIVVRSVGVERTVCEGCGNLSFEMKPTHPAYNSKPARTREPLRQAAGL